MLRVVCRIDIFNVDKWIKYTKNRRVKANYWNDVFVSRYDLELCIGQVLCE